MRYPFATKGKLSITLVCLLSFFSFSAFAQQDHPLINSGDLLKKGGDLNDKKQYKDAIELFRQINRSDTNYADALFALSVSCQADSQLEAAHRYAMLGLKEFPELYPKFSMQAANVLDDMEKPEEAMKLYDEGLKRDPQSYILYFNKGVTYLRMKNDADAKVNFERCLLISPYYTSAHYFLGNIYMREGNLVPAILAYQTYLLINPSGKYMNNCVTNLSAISKVTDDMLEYVKNKKSSSEDNFDMLQQILLSKVALDKQYKLKADLEDKIVRQMQVVNEKLEYHRNDPGFAMQFYVPIYSRLFKEDDFEPMVFTVFSGLGIKDVDSWNKKNKKDVENFIQKMVVYLNEIKYTRTLTEPERKDVTARYYFEDGEMHGKGIYNINNSSVEMSGPWEFFYTTNGLLKTKGSFSAPNQKDGEWLYYYNTGQLKERAKYNKGKLTGVLEGWFTNGNKWYEDSYEDGKVSGLTTLYFYSGLVNKTTMYKDDKKNGPQKGYSSKGYLIYTSNYVDDEQDGMQTYYYPNGNKQDEVMYKKGKSQGTYKAYYKDGKPMTQGEFVDDNKQGLWTSWYNNGAVKEKTTYLDNEITGEFTEYYEDGKLKEKGNYTKKKIDGKLEYYTDEGKLYSDATYDKGKLREINFYDDKGNVTSTTSTRKGAANITFYSSEGIKTSQGYFNRDGSKDGEFTDFYASGAVREKTNYKDGLQSGSHQVFYPNGQKSSENNFTDDSEDGYTKGYYYNGKLNYEGWVIAGEKQQDIIFYNLMGDLSSKEYYLNGELNGFSEYYNPSKVKTYDYNYHNGWLESVIQYDTTGKILVENKFEKGKGPLIYKYYDGKKYAEASYENYMLSGSYKVYYFDGSPLSVSYYKNDEQDGEYKGYYYGGQLRVEGKYKEGDKVGLWKYYFLNGKVSSEENYIDGKLSGLDKVYNQDGTLDKIINYKNGELDGEYQFYGENNQLAVVFNYKEGDLKSYTYEDKAGNRVPAIVLKARTGKINAFYKNGTQSVDMNFINNDCEGPRKIYYSTGKIYIDGTTEYGYDNGVKKLYYPNGTLWKEENYVLGNLHGSVKWYYPSGKLEKEALYYNTDLHGPYKFYDEQGKLKQVRTYYYDQLLSVK
jgi:uncharacterized protein